MNRSDTYQDFYEFILPYIQQQYANNPNIWDDCQTYLTLRHFQELVELNEKYPESNNELKTTMYTLAWATKLTKEYGAPEFWISKYSDPLHPQFYNNQELMDAEEVLNKFLIFPNKTGTLNTHFYMINLNNKSQNNMQKDNWNLHNEKGLHKNCHTEGLEIPWTEVGGEQKESRTSPSICCFLEHNRGYMHAEQKTINSKITEIKHMLKVNTNKKSYRHKMKRANINIKA